MPGDSSNNFLLRPISFTDMDSSSDYCCSSLCLRGPSPSVAFPPTVKSTYPRASLFGGRDDGRHLAHFLIFWSSEVHIDSFLFLIFHPFSVSLNLYSRWATLIFELFYFYFKRIRRRYRLIHRVIFFSASPSFGTFSVFPVSRPFLPFYDEVPAFYADILCYLGFYGGYCARGALRGRRGGVPMWLGGIYSLIHSVNPGAQFNPARPIPDPGPAPVPAGGTGSQAPRIIRE